MKFSMITRATCWYIELAVMVSLGSGVLLVGVAGNAQDMASAAAIAVLDRGRRRFVQLRIVFAPARSQGSE